MKQCIHFLNISTLSYMDDVALVAQSPSLKTNTTTLATVASIPFDWANANAVTFDDPKSEMIYFYRQRNFTTIEHQLRLPNGTMVVPKACLRWLGVWLDSKLSFKEHVKIKVAAAQRSLALIRQLANTEKGLSAAGMHQLYQSCVISVADYGSEVWWKGQTHLANKLQLLQNSATRSILRSEERRVGKEGRTTRGACPAEHDRQRRTAPA